MGFRKNGAPTSVTVTLLYPHLHHEHDADGNVILDENGRPKPQRFSYTFAVNRKGETDLLRIETRSERKFTLLERLAKLLIDEPGGFDDFPRDERTLEDRVKEYFSGKDMDAFVEDALAARANAIYPQVIAPE